MDRRPLLLSAWRNPSLTCRGSTNRNSGRALLLSKTVDLVETLVGLNSKSRLATTSLSGLVLAPLCGPSNIHVRTSVSVFTLLLRSGAFVVIFEIRVSLSLPHFVDQAYMLSPLCILSITLVNPCRD